MSECKQQIRIQNSINKESITKSTDNIEVQCDDRYFQWVKCKIRGNYQSIGVNRSAQMQNIAVCMGNGAISSSYFSYICQRQEFLIQSILMLQQINKSIQDAKDCIRFDEQDDRKMFLMTTPTKQKFSKLNSEADYIVMELSQHIGQKINWEHQKLLLWNKSEKQMDQNCQEFIVDFSAINLAFNQECYVSQIQQLIDDGKLEIRTPEFMNVEEGVSPINITLEPTSEDKRYEKDQTELEDNYSKCNCKKSECLKLYCQCFRSGKQCKGCNCRGCKNNSEADQDRRNAIKNIQQRQPTAFSHAARYKGCRCSRSGCLKGYCDCFLNGHICGKYCKCKDCANNKNHWMSKTKRNNKAKK